MSEKQKRRSVIANGDGGVDGVLATTIRNGEDLCPIVRHAFEVGKPELLLNQLKSIVKRKEIEIEELCKVHYEEFILAVDELRGVLSDADELKISLSNENSRLQDVASSLLSKLEDLLALYSTNKNISQAVHTLSFCIQVLILCSKCNNYIQDGSFHLLVKALGIIERDYVQRTPIKALRRVIERQIPAIRSYIEKKACSDFNDWLVSIRQKAREIGQLAIGQAASMRQRDADLRTKRREAEEQSSCVYALDVEQIEGGSSIKFDLLPVYRAYHVYTCLGLEKRFQKYYFDNRLLQLNLDLEVSTSQSFLESHQGFFSQITGFFIVEDGVLRTADGLLSHSQLEEIWDSTTMKIMSLLEEQFSSMEIASHFLMIKDYVSLLCATLGRYGYEVSPLLNVLDKGRDRYHELLISEFRKRVTDALENDTHEQMLIRKEYEYSMNVLAFNLQTSEIMPAFPYVAPFSASVPQICRIVRCFIEDSVNYLSYTSHVNLYDVVRKYLDRFLSDVLNESLVKIIHSGTLAVSPAMQITANIDVLADACDHFLRQTAQLCEIPVRFIQRANGSLSAQALLRSTHNVSFVELSKLAVLKVDEFMDLANNIKWTSEDPPMTSPNEYANLICIYLDTLITTAQGIFPPESQYQIASGAMQHISDSIIATFLSETVKKFSINAVICLDNDLRSVEEFVDEKFQNGSWRITGKDQLRGCLNEARQLINLLMSNQPDNFMNPVIREKNYGMLDYKKVACICDKFKDSSDTLFGSLSSRNSKQSARKKSMDTLKRRLRELS